VATDTQPDRHRRIPVVLDDAALRIALVYALCAALWILLSDQVLGALVRDPALVTTLSVAKGWVFVIVSALVLYRLLRRRPPSAAAAAGAAREEPQPFRPVLVGGVIAALLVVLIGAAAFTLRQERATQVTRLQAVATLRADETSAWIADRHLDARWIASSATLMSAYRQWRERHDEAARAMLASRLEAFRRGSTYRGVALIESPATVALGAGDFGTVTPALLAAISRARTTHEPADTDLYLAGGTAPRVALDLVAPLATAADAPVIVLRMDAEQYLYPMLRTWPGASASGETLLLRPETGGVRVVSDLRFAPDAALRRLLPGTADDIVGVQLSRLAQLPPGSVDGRDYRNTAIIAVGRRVLGTPWLLVAKIDRAELLAGASVEAMWMAMGGALTVLVVLFAARLQREQRELRLVRALKDQKDEQLRSAEILRSIARESDDAIYAKDRDGRYLLFSRGAERISGKTVAEAVGHTDTELFPAPIAARFVESDRAAIATGSPVTNETIVNSGAGDLVLAATKGPLRDASGNIIGVFGISRDVTERHRTAEELSLHRHHLEELVSHRTTELEQVNRELGERAREVSSLYNEAPCGYHSMAADGVIQQMNDTELRWLGYAREQVVGRLRVTDLLAPAYRGKFDLYYAQLTASGELKNLEVDYVRADGSLLPVLVNVTAVRNAAGAVVSTRATVFDNTDRKAREIEVARLNVALAARVRDAEAASRAKSTFLANMSHEIRTPMNAIIGLTHLLRRASSDLLQQDRLDKISEAAAHLLAVINDILDISKIEAGKLTLELDRFRPRAVVDDVARYIAQRCGEKGLELVTDVADDVPEFLLGDATRLRQALLNYASNAVKFTAAGRIRITLAPLARDPADVVVRFAVEDTGVGIPADVGERLFNSFEQADSSTTRRYGGTGLGLAITRLLARKMGGETGYSSAPGAGSTFWFTARLGVTDEPGVAGEPGTALRHRSGRTLEAELAARGRGKRVLLVEDNSVNREVASGLLGSAGLRIDMAEDGARAVQLARQRRYDAILMDVQMPVMDGIDATRAIRCVPGCEDVPIIAVSAAAFSEDRQRAAEAGMNDYIAKPFTAETLYLTLLRWIGDGGPEAPAADDVGGPSETAAREPGELEWLDSIEGLDVARGLPYARNDYANYLGLLQRFLASAGVEVGRCRSALRVNDNGSARRAVHTLKGAASFLGATAVLEQATRLDRLFREGAPAAELLDGCNALATAHAGLCAAIDARGHGRGAPAAARDTGSAAAASDCPAVAELDELEELLESGDTLANSAIAALQTELGRLLGTDAARFAREVSQFDYEAALSTLRRHRGASIAESG